MNISTDHQAQSMDTLGRGAWAEQRTRPPPSLLLGRDSPRKAAKEGPPPGLHCPEMLDPTLPCMRTGHMAPLGSLAKAVGLWFSLKGRATDNQPGPGTVVRTGPWSWSCPVQWLSAGPQLLSGPCHLLSTLPAQGSHSRAARACPCPGRQGFSLQPEPRPCRNPAPGTALAQPLNLSQGRLQLPLWPAGLHWPLPPGPDSPSQGLRIQEGGQGQR